MNDQRAHFLLMFEEAYAGARLAELAVTVVLSDGTTVEGHPAPSHPARGDGSLTEPKAGRQLAIAGKKVTLAEVIEFTVRLTPALLGQAPDERQGLEGDRADLGAGHQSRE